MAEHGSMTGKVFSGRYQIKDRIGIGGMAEVYSAQDNVLGRTVAVKVMLPQYASDPDFTRRFRQEAAAAANLQSPYIVNVYDWGQDDGTYYIVMEFVRGSDLKTAIQQRGIINQRKVAEIGTQVCQAITVAHNQDIIHRDIKPQNIMVQPDGTVKVMDFGIARAKNSVNGQTSAVLGTAHYISPEQAQGKELTAASDIYSLGIVMYEATTGQLPFDGPDAVSVALKQVREYPVPPSEINPDIDPALEDIIMTALEKEPNHRFATANDMRLALNDYLAGRATSNNNFTQQQTRVIGAARNGETQVIPTASTKTPGQDKTQTTIHTPTGSYVLETDQKKSKKGVVVAVIVALVAVIAIAGVALAWLGGGSGIDVPDLKGMTQEDAAYVLEQSGFEMGKVDSKYDDTVEAGTVIGQSPKAGSKAEKGSKIDLVVSQGAEEIDVPDLKNMTLEQAKTAAKKAGFTLSQESSDYSDSVEVDHIISQDPAAGEKAPKGSTINYILSLGSQSISIPDVTGQPESQAKSRLENAGFEVSVQRTNSDTVQSGYVVSQSPSSSDKAKKGDTVTITVSDGPSSQTIPYVIGYTQLMATSTLQNAGFIVSVSELESTSTPGTVIDQSPAGGNTASPGSTITIYVATTPSTPEPSSGGNEGGTSGNGGSSTGSTGYESEPTE